MACVFIACVAIFFAAIFYELFAADLEAGFNFLTECTSSFILKV